ncbi:hypothetical protein CHH57_02125 [Niallia circulans]|uniref:Uncharacterized protein n=1 Tax=Niallia circulans TaxID=1397 RepID=A0AA91TVI9_NIACI|nr:hypothetical protein [Niallia circulans]PAD84929.1 hypothetical protein CHH57_02125 [Niallia circulans]
MAEQSTLRQAENKVTIEGVLLEVRSTEWKSGKGMNIELDIEVKENEVHTVYGMSKYKKEDGSDNGIAKGFKTIVDEYKSVATHGREEADKVRVNQGHIGLNEYYGQDGKLRSLPRVSTNFVNRVQAGEEFDPKAEFEAELFVRSVKPELDKEGNETGRAVLEGYIPVYGGTVIPFSFKVFTEGSEYVQDNYEPGKTVFIYGDIINYKEKIVKKTESAFGKDKETVTYNTIREYVVTGGEDPYEEENVKSYDGELIHKALVERETYLAELKTKNSEPKKEEKKGGFGNKSNSGEKAKFDPSKLPF